MIFLFAPIPDIAKYIVGGLPWLVVVVVWFQFWSRAKHEPLSASETYYIHQLRYRYMGGPPDNLTVEQIEEEIRESNAEIRRISGERDSS